MKKMKSIFTGSILAFIFLVTPVMIFAQQGYDAGRPPRGGSDQVMPPQPPEQHGANANQKPGSVREQSGSPLTLPDLSNDQRDKIKKADLKQIQLLTPMRNQLREKRDKLATILATPPVTLADAEALADDIGKLETSILKQQIRHDQELRAILTPDQQILFDARPKPFLKKREARK
jgi:Spy/CpxP family protein refolding chaperone